MKKIIKYETDKEVITRYLHKLDESILEAIDFRGQVNSSINSDKSMLLIKIMFLNSSKISNHAVSIEDGLPFIKEVIKLISRSDLKEGLRTKIYPH